MVLGRVPGPIRFGRSVDESGFAVMDGERVGRASWVGGTVEWFAEQNATDLDLGPDNRIAFIQKVSWWCAPRPPHCDWKMTPQLGMAPDGKVTGGILFCWRVRDGALDLVRFRTDVEDSAVTPHRTSPPRC